MEWTERELSRSTDPVIKDEMLYRISIIEGRNGLEFTKSWEMPDDSMQLEEEAKIVSILKIEKLWNLIEYLILKENSMQYISTNIWTGQRIW